MIFCFLNEGCGEMYKDTKIKFAIVGCGDISRIHAMAISSIENAEIVAVCSRNIQKAKILAKEYNVPNIYSNYIDMMDNCDIDIVDILTPNSLHCDVTLEAAKHGMHVIVEKPIEISLSRADLMINACATAGVKLCIISQHRFDESSIILKKTIDEGKLGKIVLGDAHIKWYRSQDYYDSAAWRGNKEFGGGGILINQGIHTIDLLLYFLGDVKDVYGYCGNLGHERIDVEDTATAILRFKSGALGTIIGSTSAYPGLPAQIEINGTEGSAKIEGDNLIYVKSKNMQILNDCNNNLQCPNINDFDYTSHMLQIKDMLSAISENREPLVNGLEGRKALDLILKISGDGSLI